VFASTRQRGRFWRWLHRKSAFCLPIARFEWDRRTPEERRRGDDLLALQFSKRATLRMLAKFGPRGHFDDRGCVRENQFRAPDTAPTNVLSFGSRAAR
jgi:hypothetical protein